MHLQWTGWSLSYYANCDRKCFLELLWLCQHNLNEKLKKHYNSIIFSTKHPETAYNVCIRMIYLNKSTILQQMCCLLINKSANSSKTSMTKKSSHSENLYLLKRFYLKNSWIISLGLKQPIHTCNITFFLKVSNVDHKVKCYIFLPWFIVW